MRCYSVPIDRASVACSLLILLAVFGASCSSPAPPAPAAEPDVAAGPGIVSGIAPRAAMVTLLPADGDEPMPAGPAVMDQYAKTFVPSVLYVRVGQPVEFRNTEDMPHNVNVIRRGTGAAVFSVATEPQQQYVHTFERMGQYDVACDIHPGMQALVVAAPGSRVTIADEQGAFTIPNVPAGSYRVSVTFEGRTVEQAVEVSDARTSVRIATP